MPPLFTKIFICFSQYFQMISPPAGVGPSGPQIDFLTELRQAMHNSNAHFWQVKLSTLEHSWSFLFSPYISGYVDQLLLYVLLILVSDKLYIKDYLCFLCFIAFMHSWCDTLYSLYYLVGVWICCFWNLLSDYCNLKL